MQLEHSWYETYDEDRLVMDGQTSSEPQGCKKQLHRVREQLLTAVIDFIEAIETKLKLLNNPPNGPLAHADNLSANTDADRSLGNRIP